MYTAIIESFTTPEPWDIAEQYKNIEEQRRGPQSPQIVHPNGGKQNYRGPWFTGWFSHANLSMAMAIKVNALKKIWSTLLSTLLGTSSSAHPILLEFLEKMMMFSLREFTAAESQTRPRASPVFSSFVEQKGTLEKATFHTTEKRTARAAPVMLAETCMSRWETSGADFFSERRAILPLFLSKITNRRLSQAWKKFFLYMSLSLAALLISFLLGDGFTLAVSGLRIRTKKCQITTQRFVFWNMEHDNVCKELKHEKINFCL